MEESGISYKQYQQQSRDNYAVNLKNLADNCNQAMQLIHNNYTTCSQNLVSNHNQANQQIENNFQISLQQNLTAYYQRVEYERQVEEAQSAARRRGRRQWLNMGLSIVASFVIPGICTALLPQIFLANAAANILSVQLLVQGAIMGGVNSLINGTNLLQGIATGGLFAGFSHGANNLFGKLIEKSTTLSSLENTMSSLLRSPGIINESFTYATTASLSTMINGGKLLNNIAISLSANTVSKLVVPSSVALVSDKTKLQEVSRVFNQRHLQVGVSSIVAGMLGGNDLGQSLLIAGATMLESGAKELGQISGERLVGGDQVAQEKTTQKDPSINKPLVVAKDAPKKNVKTNGNNTNSTAKSILYGKANLPKIGNYDEFGFIAKGDTKISSAREPLLFRYSYNSYRLISGLYYFNSFSFEFLCV